MNTRDRRQRARACQTLLALEGRADLWGRDGPEVAAQLERCAELDSSDARILVLLCWAIWDGTGIAAAADLLRLQPRNLRAVGDLFHAVARGRAAIEDWIETWSAHAKPARQPLRSLARTEA